MRKATALLICTLLFITGCSTANISFNKKAERFGFAQSTVQGTGFIHAVFENNLPNNGQVLHVYLGGDGSPWFKGRYVTRDPTPLKPVMLPLMALDRRPAIYLGRPCYHHHRMPANCNKRLWTNQRYSSAVVLSMIAALKKYAQRHGYRKIRLFGFSGGGTLAMLMAQDLTSIQAIVTIAGNLDTDAWTRHHNYLPLTGSMNPQLLPPLPAKIKQYHVAGRLDKNIPDFMVESAASRQKDARYILLNGADHHCCWQQAWPEILKELEY